MIALLQRVTQAAVVVDGVTVGAIKAGLMVLVCAERGDTDKEAQALLTKLLAYRVFSDAAGKMNRSVVDVARLVAGAAIYLGGRYAIRNPPVVYACCCA